MEYHTFCTRICGKKLSFEPTSSGRYIFNDSQLRSANVSIHGNKPQSRDNPDGCKLQDSVSAMNVHDGSLKRSTSPAAWHFIY